MARPLRIEYEGACYHVTARGNDRKKIFFTERDYERFKKYLSNAKERYGCVLHAYVLMDNHYHLLLETPQGNLSKIMHYLNGSYTTYINTKRKRSGHLFQGRYKSIVIDKDSYLLELSRYIHLNPVSAGMRERPEDYSHSSYRSYLSLEEDELVHRDQILRMFTDKKPKASETYQEFVESALGTEQAPLKNIYGGMALGGERFIRDILDRLAEKQIEPDEVSHHKALLAAATTEDVIDAICAARDLAKQELASPSNRKERNIAIYLLKTQTAASNKEIGDMFGGLSYSAVAKTFQRFGKRMGDDADLVREVDALKERVSGVKG